MTRRHLIGFAPLLDNEDDEPDQIEVLEMLHVAEGVMPSTDGEVS